ncbi:hypothetical protein [Onishia taeanensis]
MKQWVNKKEIHQDDQGDRLQLTFYYLLTNCVHHEAFTGLGQPSRASLLAHSSQMSRNSIIPHPTGSPAVALFGDRCNAFSE